MRRTVVQEPPVVALPDVEVVQRQLTGGQDVIELRTDRVDHCFLTLRGEQSKELRGNFPQ